MNLFDFKLMQKKIDSLTLVRDLEAELRKQQSVAPDYCKYNYGSPNLEVLCLTYRLYTQTLHCFRQKSSATLPDFLYKFKEIMEETLTYNYFEDIKASMTYEEYIELFKHSGTITFRSNTGKSIETLAKIVQNNPNPYKLAIAFRPTAYYRELANYNSLLERIYKVEHIKQNLDPSIKYTILEDILAGYYSATTANTNPDRYKLHLELKQVMETVAKKTDNG